MRNYTVLLLYPDYMSNNFGQETYLANVVAHDPNDAIDTARADCVEENEHIQIEDRSDLFVLAVFKGKLEDLKP
jgi:hypothetical protein